MSTLINPTRPNSQAEDDFEREPVYLRSPVTGVIFKLYHKDTITRCLREFFMPSSEEAMLAQSAELAELQGRKLPEATPEATPEAAPAADAPVSEPEAEPEPVSRVTRRK